MIDDLLVLTGVVVLLWLLVLTGVVGLLWLGLCYLYPLVAFIFA